MLKEVVFTRISGVLMLLTAALLWSCDDASMTVSPPEDPPERVYPLVLRQAGTVETEMRDVRAVAWDSEGILYVGGGQGVGIFEPSTLSDSEAAFERKDFFETAQPVSAVAVDEEGNIYAASRRRVTVLGKDGSQKAVWDEEGEDAGQFMYITGIAVDDPVVSVADAGRRTVLRFAVNGDLVDEIDGFHVPSPYFDLTYDTQGRLHVANPGNHRIERYDSTGVREDSWGIYAAGAEGFAGCCNPTNVAVLSDGRVVTTEKGTPRLKVISADKERKILAVEGPSDFPAKASGMDLAIGPEDRIAVIERVTDKVRIYTLEASAGRGTRGDES